MAITSDRPSVWLENVGVTAPSMVSIRRCTVRWSAVKSMYAPDSGMAASATRSVGCSRSMNWLAASISGRPSPRRMLPRSTTKTISRPPTAFSLVL